MELLRALTETPGVSGREERVRALVTEQVRPLVDEVETDPMGSLIARRSATDPPAEGRPLRVMLAAHLDEIGFYVKHIDTRGFLRLHNLGGFDARNLFARRVLVQGTEDLVGLLNPSGPPIHLAREKDKKKVPEIKEFFVDLGLDAAEVKQKVRVGDPVTLQQPCADLGRVVTGKAMDNRVACWVAIRTLERLERTPFDLAAVFTVQEEVGLRGAGTSAYGIEPDIGIAIDTTLAVDTPGTDDDEAVTRLGGGVGIKVVDGASISDRGLVDRCVELAEANEIPCQLEILPRGGTDAGTIQRSRAGVRAITLSVPTRYIHTVTETVHKEDLEAAVALLVRFLSEGI